MEMPLVTSNYDIYYDISKLQLPSYDKALEYMKEFNTNVELKDKYVIKGIIVTNKLVMDIVFDNGLYIPIGNHISEADQSRIIKVLLNKIK